MEENKEVIEIKKEENTENSKTTTTKDRKGLCIAAMVLGIVSLVLCCIWFIAIPCAILAIIFGIIGIKTPEKGMAIAGLVTGAISITLTILALIAIIMFGVTTGIVESTNYYNRYNRNDYDYNYSYDDYDNTNDYE